ncbi:MAG: hypothetical protein A4E44_00588 [Methanosaeta sp. PtaB.Bin018]|jgi:hypothetical protein|nr:MAG: hypothetical protein A4E44_00588 [Methanosaeta sp. PtaB.Bin018]
MFTWMQVSHNLFSMILILAALFLLFLVLVLITPFDLSLGFRIRGPLMQVSYKIIWLGVVIKKGFIEPASDDEPSSTDATGQGSSPPLGSLLDAILAILPALKDLSKSINLQKASCSLCFGLDDPVQTAVMSGYLWSLAAATCPSRTSIHIEPCFDKERLEGDITVELGARMLWPSVALIKALREKRIRELLIMMIRERR